MMVFFAGSGMPWLKRPGDKLEPATAWHEEMKKPEDAMRVYGQVVEKYPGTRWSQHALMRMTALKSK